MGLLSAAGFDLGFLMGLASFQASRGQANLAGSALANGQAAADLLSKNGKMPAHNLLNEHQGTASAVHTKLVQTRVQYENEIRAKSNQIANAYRFGLLIGLAEGQASVKGGAAVDLAHDALLKAQTVAQQNLTGLIDAGLMGNALNLTQNFAAGVKNTHAAVVALRTSSRDNILRSALP